MNDEALICSICHDGEGPVFWAEDTEEDRNQILKYTEWAIIDGKAFCPNCIQNKPFSEQTDR